ncbi:glycerophosphodiester phosphodiesterase [Lysobacter daejeonensis GH1-9]|uniref:glycerophosphodiester phosphodiesterase n=1 Tax=Lysobacter daejeonensis GH1-9 TaxID=1385517 RepID=A0A0A0F192_9GAMM|nr:glycerophosphodiester phosphodiesterase [Lysobacter daejeonensis]KGM56315.1 glycerophosphodiester phosphodiesterase [Lysobacter daejeonensis GH1-9]
MTSIAPPSATPVVIAHRGASALRPEHTLGAYAQAIADGADYIEPDLVITRDGVLVARHESELSATTDVASHAEFTSRRRRQVIDGHTVEGWFTEDFTLDELKTLRVRERFPALRSTAHDGRYPIATLDEVIALLASESERAGRSIGLIPEIKHPSHFRRLGLAMEDRVLERLGAHAYTRSAPVVIQSFEVGNLRYLGERLAGRPNIRLLQLLGAPDRCPADQVEDEGCRLSYGQMMGPQGLRAVAEYAQVLGPPSRLVIPVTTEGALGTPTALVRDAHAVGLQVQPYTFRPENHFLPPALWRGEDPRTLNPEGSIAEIRACLEAGIDGFFTDDPRLGRRAVDDR